MALIINNFTMSGILSLTEIYIFMYIVLFQLRSEREETLHSIEKQEKNLEEMSAKLQPVVVSRVNYPLIDYYFFILVKKIRSLTCSFIFEGSFTFN